MATETGFASYWQTKKPFISADNRKRRISWAREHQQWSEQQWRQVLCSEESPFVLIFNRKKGVWRAHNERYYEIFATKATVKHDVKIKVWGCFCYTGVGRLFRVIVNLDAKQYKNILRQQTPMTYLARKNSFFNRIMIQSIQPASYRTIWMRKMWM